MTTTGSMHTADARLDAQARAAVAALRHTLDAVFAQGAPADRELAAFFAALAYLGSRDRRLIGAAVHAVLRWWGWVEGMVPSDSAAAADEAWLPLLAAAVSLDPPEHPEFALRLARRLGFDESSMNAGLARPAAADRLAAVLRLLYPGAATPELNPLALAPSWLGEELAEPAWHARYAAALQTRPPVWLRLQGGDPATVLDELKRAGLHPEPHATVPRAVRLADARPDLRALPVYRDRRVEVQDLASQIVGLACGARPGARWWDVCAGAGGKSLQLASIMEDRGSVLATDTRLDALRELDRRARAAGLRSIRSASSDADLPARDRPPFDGVLVDAPCTGSGAWRRNPWARLQLARGDIARYAARQRALLESHAHAVRPGGVLVYATCSVFRAENAAVVQWFLDGFPDFRPDPFPNPLGGATRGGVLQVWPWDGDCDSLFVVRLRRAGDCARSATGSCFCPLR